MRRFCLKLILIALAFVQLYAQSFFSGSEIKEKLLYSIREKVGNDAEVILPKVISDFTFPQDNVSISFDFGKQTLSGNLFVGIEFWRNENKLRRVEIPVRIKVIAEVLVAKRTISRGEIISEENISVEKRELPSSIELKSTSFENILGKTAKYSIVRGTILTNELVQEPFAIKRGEKVRVVVLSGKVQVSTYGVALNDANSGEQVRVRREGNGNILVGLATKDGCVVISK
ncbi:MAG: flagellar basal body P-ring formation chaperone FlgA [Ignavibacteria bacterium]|nr:flagellar basal body P-ring formation chaperone FlgA [Ignavibacteria bacterium]